MTQSIVLMVAHGSPSPEAIQQTQAFQRQFAERCSAPVQLCYLELTAPDLESGLRQAVASAGKGGTVAVLPLFLGAASHQKNDLPVALQWARREFPDVRFVCSTPFEPHANLVALLDLRVQEAIRQSSPQALSAGDSTVLVVARGSSDPDSNSEIARTARLLYEKRDYRWVEYAYQAVARPDIAAGVERAALCGARQLIVAPYLLFTGYVEQEILAKASAAASARGLAFIAAQPLGVHPLLVEVALQRVDEALAGTAAMTCDLCKYRLPMAGYTAQVGLASSSHHFAPGGETH